MKRRTESESLWLSVGENAKDGTDAGFGLRDGQWSYTYPASTLSSFSNLPSLCCVSVRLFLIGLGKIDSAIACMASLSLFVASATDHGVSKRPSYYASLQYA